MHALLGASRHDSGLIFVAGALALLSVGVLSGHGVKVLAPLTAIVGLAAASRRAIIGWHRLIALIVLVVMFVPIGRYKLPGSLPFDLELYRVVVAICLLVWIASLLVDSRVQLVSTPFDPPLLLILACVLGSEVTNPSRVGTLSSNVVKSLTFLASFVLVYYLTATTIRRRVDAEFLLKLLTLSGAAIGIFAVFEQRTHYNVFDHLHSILPFSHSKGRWVISSLGPMFGSLALRSSLLRSARRSSSSFLSLSISQGCPDAAGGWRRCCYLSEHSQVDLERQW